MPESKISKLTHRNEMNPDTVISADTEKRWNHMEYMEEMEQISSDIKDSVIKARSLYEPESYTHSDVRMALANTERTPYDLAALLSPAADSYLEEMAAAAKLETRKHFGNSVYLFTPLYISNYCENNCVYCGFHYQNKIHRMCLSMTQIEEEMAAIAETGLEEILILVGESKKMSDIAYLGEACKIANRYFKTVCLEVYPMNTEEYAYLHSCGADYVTVFQETYDSDKYETLHLRGPKRVFPYRMEAQERALMGGMRGVAFGALLGLSDFRKDAYATAMHAYYIQRKYPYAELSFSCPRLCPAPGEVYLGETHVSERQLLQIILAYRLFMPYAGITVSTRENKNFRDHVSQIAVTKISAGVSTGIGEHSHQKENTGDEQFEIADPRSVDEIYHSLLEHHMQPVMNDYINTEQESSI